MHDFLRKNQADNRGFFDKESLTEDQKNEIKKIEGNAKPSDFFDEQTNKKGDDDMDESVWDFYKSTFDLHKKRMIKKKMNGIKQKVDKEFDSRALHQNFLTTNTAKIDLDEFKLKLHEKGLNPYDFLDKQDIYKVNANLTFFEKEISNAVPELQDLNETSIMNKLVDVTKLIADDNKNMESVEKYVESKLFSNDSESKFFLIENPYIDVNQKINDVGTPNIKNAVVSKGFINFLKLSIIFMLYLS